MLETSDLRVVEHASLRGSLCDSKLDFLVLSDVIDFDPLAEVGKDGVLGFIDSRSESGDLSLDGLEGGSFLDRPARRSQRKALRTAEEG
jgi:hypothetical protein